MRSVLPETPPKVAVIVVVPAATDVANPLEVLALLMVATPKAEEVHVAWVVRSWAVASEYVPIAVNCCRVPCAIDEFEGVTVIDRSVAGVTVRTVFPEIIPTDAEMVVVPADTEVARPSEPEALLMVARFVLDEAHATSAVKSCVEASENVPMAVNCSELPTAIEGVAGVTSIDSNIASVTVNKVSEVTRPKVAVTVDVPTSSDVANPFDPETLLTVAMFVSEDDQVTSAVRSCVVPSEYIPTA